MVIKVTCMQPIEHDQKRFDVGSEISLPDEAAAPLLAIGHVAPIASKKAKAEAKPAETAADAGVEASGTSQGG